MVEQEVDGEEEDEEDEEEDEGEGEGEGHERTTEVPDSNHHTLAKRTANLVQICDRCCRVSCCYNIRRRWQHTRRDYFVSIASYS